MTDTLAARHLAVLRAAAVRASSIAEIGISPAYDAKFHERLHDAVEWVGNMLDILSCCEFCGTPYAIRNPGCPCERCDCGRVVDQVPCDSCRRTNNET